MAIRRATTTSRSRPSDPETPTCSCAIFKGQRWPLWNPQRGIFKPRGMPFLLSIRTVVPRKGGRIWYDDQRHVHQQIFAGEEERDYAFIGTDPEAPDTSGSVRPSNGRFRSSTSSASLPGGTKPSSPTFVVNWNPHRLTARTAFGKLAGATRHRTRRSAAMPSAWPSIGCIIHRPGQPARRLRSSVRDQHRSAAIQPGALWGCLQAAGQTGACAGHDRWQPGLRRPAQYSSMIWRKRVGPKLGKWPPWTTLTGSARSLSMVAR